MNKLSLTLLLACLSVSAQAAPTDTIQTPSENPYIQQQIGVKLQFGRLETENSQLILHPDNHISRSKSDQLCWRVTLDNRWQKQQVFSVFASPKGATFTFPNVKVDSNADKTRHQLSTSLQPDSKGLFQQCWKFDSRDLLGDYSLMLRIGDKQFAPFNFIVTP